MWQTLTKSHPHQRIFLRQCRRRRSGSFSVSDHLVLRCKNYRRQVHLSFFATTSSRTFSAVVTNVHEVDNENERGNNNERTATPTTTSTNAIPSWIHHAPPAAKNRQRKVLLNALANTLEQPQHKWRLDAVVVDEKQQQQEYEEYDNYQDATNHADPHDGNNGHNNDEMKRQEFAVEIMDTQDQVEFWQAQKGSSANAPSSLLGQYLNNDNNNATTPTPNPAPVSSMLPPEEKVSPPDSLLVKYEQQQHLNDMPDHNAVQEQTELFVTMDKEESSPIEQSSMDGGKQQQQHVAALDNFHGTEHLQGTAVGTKEDAEQVVKTADPANADRSERPLVKRLQRQFNEAVLGGRLSSAQKTLIYAQSKRIDQYLDSTMLRRLFHLANQKCEPFASRSILRFCRPRLDLSNPYDRKRLYYLYERLCFTLRFVNPETHAPWQIEGLIRSVVAEVNQFPEAGRVQCLPAVLSSLVQQRLVVVGKFARSLYEAMKTEKFPFTPAYLEHLLSCSKYQRQTDLPYAEILLTTVRKGRRPNPQTVMSLVANLFPYHKMDDVSMVLQALIELQAQKKNDRKSYKLDMALIETITNAVAQKGDFDAVQLVWEYLVTCGMEPSIGVYEATAVTFCYSVEKYPNAFAVLEEMQARGCKPSRALIRSMSDHVKKDMKNIEAALELVLDDVDAWCAATEEERKEGKVPTFPLAALNIIISSLAENTELDRVVQLMNMVEESKLPVDENTFSFAFESLGRHMTFRRHRYRDEQQIGAYIVGKAMEYLDMMEAREISVTHFIIRDYVEVLCGANDIDTATQVVLDALERGAVSGKTLYKVAISNAEHGRFDIARQLATSGTEEMHFLLQRIQGIEKGTSVFSQDDFPDTIPKYSRS